MSRLLAASLFQAAPTKIILKEAFRLNKGKGSQKESIIKYPVHAYELHGLRCLRTQ